MFVRIMRKCTEESLLGTSRKAWVLITIFATSFSVSSYLFFRREGKMGYKKNKVVVKSHSFLLDPLLETFKKSQLKKGEWVRSTPWRTMIEQKGMITVFCYSFSFPSSLFFKEGREKGKRIIKVLVKSHAFLLVPILENFKKC